MRLHALQLARGDCPHLASNLVVPRRDCHQRAAFDHRYPAIGDRFGGECVRFPGLEPENITGQMKRPDLPAAVDQHLVGPHSAADDFVKVVRRLILAVNLGISSKRHGRAHELDHVGTSAARRERRIS